jgi:hypothetical protein
VQTIKYADNCAHVVFEAIPSFAEKVRKRVEEFDGKFEKNIATQQSEAYA